MILCQLLLRKMGKERVPNEFFDQSGISQATWSRINRGLSHFNIEDLRSAARAAGIDLHLLISDADRIASELPKEDVAVIEPTKLPRGTAATPAKKKSGNGAVGALVAGATLAFLISRILG